MRRLGLLGDPTRRAIFELLARRPCSVGELARQLPISRPAISQHLRVLKDGGLVVSRAEGTRRVYRLDPDAVAARRAWLDHIWDQASTFRSSPGDGDGAGALGGKARRPAATKPTRRPVGFVLVPAAAHPIASLADWAGGPG
jgi:DNA-binding transcriptional ArsR family regulator